MLNFAIYKKKKKKHLMFIYQKDIWFYCQQVCAGAHLYALYLLFMLFNAFESNQLAEIELKSYLLFYFIQF